MTDKKKDGGSKPAEKHKGDSSFSEGRGKSRQESIVEWAVRAPQAPERKPTTPPKKDGD